MSAALTADMPHWLALLFVGLALAAYATCGVLTLVSRLRGTARRDRSARLATAHDGGDKRREVTR